MIAAKPARGSVPPRPSSCPRSTTGALRRPDQPAPRLQRKLPQLLHLINNRGAKEAMRYRHSRRGPERYRDQSRVIHCLLSGNSRIPNKKPATDFSVRALQFSRRWRYAGDLPDVSNRFRAVNKLRKIRRNGFDKLKPPRPIVL